MAKSALRSAKVVRIEEETPGDDVAANEAVASAEQADPVEEAPNEEVDSTEEGDITEDVASTEETAPVVEAPSHDIVPVNDVSPARDAALTPTRLALFGQAPLLDDEDSDAYDELLARVSGTVKPADVLEEILVQDFVDLTWEGRRMRHLKVHLLAAEAYRGLQRVLDPLCGYIRAKQLAAAWATRDEEAVAEVKELLANAELSMDEVRAQTLALKIVDIGLIDRMIMNAETRRNLVLREVDRHRTTLGRTLRKAASEVEDAEFTEIQAPQIENEPVE
jgi:hypothetical protein